MLKQKPHFGEIWMCHLTDRSGSVQSGYRPVFVISNDKNNTYSNTFNIIPITSKFIKRNLPVHVVLLNYWVYGLREPSTILVEQTTTVGINCLDKRIGKIIDRNILLEISKAMMIQFPIFSLS